MGWRLTKDLSATAARLWHEEGVLRAYGGAKENRILTSTEWYKGKAHKNGEADKNRTVKQ